MRQSKNLLLLFLLILLNMVIFDLKAWARKLFFQEKATKVNTAIIPSGLDAVGFDTAIFNHLEQQIIAENYGALHSLLVVYDNKLVVEKYYNKWEKETIHDIQSSTKSIASALIGIAIDKGYIHSVKDRLPDLLPEHSFSSDDKVKKSIRLKDLLTMSPGFDWDEQQVKYNEKGNSLTDMYARNMNWIDYILSLKMTEKPGTKFNYNSGASILLGAILQAKTGMKVGSFAEKYLFEPLGISKYHWSEYFGVAHCGGGLYLTSLDMARIGNMFLNDGEYDGKKIISSGWVRDSFRPRFGAGNKTYYGYQWWMIDSVFNFEPIMYAAGNGWQFIFIIREFNTVIVTTGSNYVEEGLKTTLSQYELIYSVLSCNPTFREKINSIYHERANGLNLNFYEILLLAQSLNSQGEYPKTISFLDRFSEHLKNDFRYCYYLGEAYYKTGNKEQSGIYLENCARLCEKQNFPEPGYSKMAKDILLLMKAD